MPIRAIPFVNSLVYHIYNRGCEKRRVFDSRLDYKRFVKTLTYYQLSALKPKFSIFMKNQSQNLITSTKVIEILSYCLMPNHFHLILRQVADGGITDIMSHTSLSYTKYYNKKYNRVGPLFQGEFKAVLVESDEQLLHLSRYIHLNPLVSYLVKDLRLYEWSSYKEYSDNLEGICSKEEILHPFKSPKDYQQFILDQEDYGKTLELIKHQLIEDS